MNYQGSQLLPQPFEHVCQALLDPAVLQQRIAGCKKFEHTGGDYKCILKIFRAKVSPLFASTETLADAVSSSSCARKVACQGAMVGVVRGQAHVLLAPESGVSRRSGNTRSARDHTFLCNKKLHRHHGRHHRVLRRSRGLVSVLLKQIRI